MNVYSRQKIIFAKQYCLKGNGQCGFKFTEIPAKICTAAKPKIYNRIFKLFLSIKNMAFPILQNELCTV